MDPIPFLRDRSSQLLNREIGVLAVLLVGSYARGTQRPDSDIDVMVIASNPSSLVDSTLWLDVFGDHTSPTIENFGDVTSIRCRISDLEFEFSVGTKNWPGLPLDPGTRRVLSDGYQIILDPAGVMQPIRGHFSPVERESLIPLEVESFWQRFLDLSGDPFNRAHRRFNWFEFGAQPDDLAELVVNGVKRGTSSLLASWHHEGVEIPKVGSFSVVLNGSGKPNCIVELEMIEILRYDEFDESRALVEGEGKGDLASWRELHHDFFDSECRSLGRAMSSSELIVFERFRLVFGGTNLTSSST